MSYLRLGYRTYIIFLTTLAIASPERCRCGITNNAFLNLARDEIVIRLMGWDDLVSAGLPG